MKSFSNENELPRGLVVAENVQGSDDRIFVSDTTAFPFRAVVKVELDFDGDGSYDYVGSGAMIGSNDVLTAGHNLYDPDLGFVKGVRVTPGLAGSSEPFGSAYAKTVTVPTEYVTSGASFDYDIGVINLGTDIGVTTGWFGYEANTAASITGTDVNLAGYPADLSSGLYMYRAYDDIDGTLGSTRIYYDGALDSAGGMSGGPVWRYDGSDRYIVGVHTFGGSTYNGGTLLTSDFFDRIQAWADDDTVSLVGTPGGDALTGTGGADTMRGYYGADTMSGGAGDDLIFGNHGLDYLDGSDGDDRIWAGQNDSPVGSDGVMRNGIDTVLGGSGDDVIGGNHGADILSGGAGQDTIYGGQDADTIFGGDDDDLLFGNLGDDILYGDNSVSSTGAGSDTIDGGAGTDTAVYLLSRGSYSLTLLADGSISVNGFDLLSDIELIRFADTTVSVSSLF